MTTGPRLVSEPSETTGPDVQPRVEVFPPTLREVLLRPRWLALLGLCLAVAGIFAWLGQWQLGRSIDFDPMPPGATEEVQPLADVVAPGAYLPEPFVGQRVEVTGTWIEGDFLPVASRFNDGVEGFWVTGQLRVSPGPDLTAPTSLAVAIGWAPTMDAAAAAIEELGTEAPGEPVTLTGRIISDEGPTLPPRGADPFVPTRMSPPMLLSQWHDIEGLDVYRAYLAADEASGGLADIVSRPPEAGSRINWLNIFYAAEWAIFAGFAFYLWYRLGKDAWEKEIEDLEDAAAEAV